MSGPRITRGDEPLPADVDGSVVTVGTFDGVHLGHRNVIDRLVARARLSGLRSVLVTFEPHPLEVIDPDRAPLRLTTEVSSVSHGTVIGESPSNSATMGAKATTMIESFRATCERVKYGSPLHSWLQTNTMAVHGAAASRIRPAM